MTVVCCVEVTECALGPGALGTLSKRGCLLLIRVLNFHNDTTLMIHFCVIYNVCMDISTCCLRLFNGVCLPALRGTLQGGTDVSLEVSSAEAQGCLELASLVLEDGFFLRLLCLQTQASCRRFSFKVEYWNLALHHLHRKVHVTK